MRKSLTVKGEHNEVVAGQRTEEEDMRLLERGNKQLTAEFFKTRTLVISIAHNIFLGT
jgi:hypothetical protein